MRTLTLAEWVGVGQLVAAAGVILSLLLVVYGLEKNTEARRQALVPGFGPGFRAHEAVFAP